MKKAYTIFVSILCVGLLIYIFTGSGPSRSAPEASNPPAVAAQAYRAPAATQQPAVKTYILNKNTKKFHKPTCKSVRQMKESNKRTFEGTRTEVINMGYSPCGNCHP